MMMWLHPVLQAIGLGLACWTFFMGIQRFRFQHLGHKVAFAWKTHVVFGKIVHAVWLFGIGAGLLAAKVQWGMINLTGTHFIVGIGLVPLIVVGLGTGLMLQKPKGKRTRLALLHGITNTFAFGFAMFQLYSGIEVVQLFLPE